MTTPKNVKSPPKPSMPPDLTFAGRLAGTLLGICAAAALLLGVTNYYTAPVISRLQAERTRAAMSQVLAAGTYEELSLDVPGVTAFYAAYNGSVCAGYVAETSASGSQGPINLVVGIDVDGNVTGVSVTSHKETANLGTKVVGSQAVLDRFIGMNLQAGEITVNSGSNCVDGVSGATITAKGVAAGVNAALNAYARRDEAAPLTGAAGENT